MIEYPKTLEEAKQYKYNRWGGNPVGNAYIEGLCVYAVWSGDRSAFEHQCNNKNGYGAAGLYCKRHAQKLHMIEAPKPKPRKRSYHDWLFDQVQYYRAACTGVTFTDADPTGAVAELVKALQYIARNIAPDSSASSVVSAALARVRLADGAEKEGETK